MKKRYLKLLILSPFLFMYFIVGCGSPAHVRGSMSNKMLGQNLKIAVASDDMLAEAIAGELLTKGFTIVERTSLYRVLSEKLIATSGLTEEDKLVSAGKLLNVDALLFVKMVPSDWKGRVESAVVKLVDVKKGELLGLLAIKMANNRKSLCLNQQKELHR